MTSRALATLFDGSPRLSEIARCLLLHLTGIARTSHITWHRVSAKADFAGSAYDGAKATGATGHT